MTDERLPLSSRRKNQSIELAFEGVRYQITIGFYQNGRIGEVWLNGPRPDSALYHITQDACVLISHLLQRFASPHTLYDSLPLLMRCYNAAATGTAQRMEVADVSVIARDLALNRLWPTVMAGAECGSYNNPRGAAVAQSANYTNNTAPVSATLSNTAAGYTTLGGQFQFAAVAGAETDYTLFAFQVPVAAAGGGNRNLVIRGVRIETFNMGAASATTPTLLQWALGVGSTAVSLATADSNTAGTRSPRRVPLGIQSMPVGTPIGGALTPIDVNLDAPLYVAAGTFVHVILRMPVGTATASQIIRGLAMINGYFE